ncbi:MAG TPA: hypothetical protein VJK05_05015 [archaeon]|nr:hypothetical protein [archaeon]
MNFAYSILFLFTAIILMQFNLVLEAIIAGIIFVLLLLFSMSRKTVKGLKKGKNKLKGLAEEEWKALEAAPGQYPAGMFTEIGKTASKELGGTAFTKDKEGIGRTVVHSEHFFSGAERFFEYLKKLLK